MKTIFYKNHGFESHFTLLYSFYCNLINTNGYSITSIYYFYQCNLCYLPSFFLESILFIYILYQITFFKQKKNNYKLIHFTYVNFLILLTTISIVIYCFFCVDMLIGTYVITNKYVFFSKITILFLMIISLIISSNKYINYSNKTSLTELPIIFSFLLLFIFLLFSSYDFFIIYLCVEGISLILYTLGSLMHNNLINIESIVKYFIINNMASSTLLWSISYFYILVGSTDAFDIEYYIITKLEIITISNLYYILFILICSICCKLALFPFQWWIMDVFEGLWTPITIVYAVIIKVAFFLFFFKLVFGPLQCLIFLFQPFLLISAVGSIVYGSICALTQVRIKRFIAYTSIAQSGYITMGLTCNSMNGAISSLLYLVMYCIITLSFFTIIINTEHIVKKNTIIYLNQLYSLFFYNKEISLHLILIMLIMAAIPPFSSFFTKFFIFFVCIDAKLELTTIVLLSVTLISTFYYLNFIQELIFLKYKNNKFFYYNNKTINFLYLKINSIFFIMSIFFLPFFYNLGLNLFFSCAYLLIV